MGKAPLVPLPKKVTSRKHARRITTAYHAITEKLHSARDEAEASRLHADLAALGGVRAYQQASALNTALHSTSRWVIHSLRACGLLPASPPPRLLEVGAVNTQLLEHEGLAVRAIDLHSSHPRIEQCDFFALPHGGEWDASLGRSVSYDAVVCSMVLNCVPDARRRFEMLVGVRAQLRAGGRAFITLPRTCLSHSFTIDQKLFAACLRGVGLRPVAIDKRPVGAEGGAEGGAGAGAGKLAYFECVATLPERAAAEFFQAERHRRRRSRTRERKKSRGAGFDIDVGGYLGFGERIARSYEAASDRSKKEQGLVEAAFLDLCREQDAAAVAAAAAAARRGGEACEEKVRRGVVLSLQELAALEDEAPPAAPPAEGEADWARAEIDRMAASVPREQLDFSRWRWYAEAGGGARGRGRWVFAPRGGAFPRGSSSERTGWEWAEEGWTYRQPSEEAAGGRRAGGVKRGEAAGRKGRRERGSARGAASTLARPWWRMLWRCRRGRLRRGPVVALLASSPLWRKQQSTGTTRR
ncbi:hypothetical protein AB1Y20_022120 [Prymnesium parvum]|uniref:Methyltransferase BMT2 homolog n=1 Tax=Prymnesium parvum TaxID=97485 RepID=A0AB34JF96_PRYPA